MTDDAPSAAWFTAGALIAVLAAMAAVLGLGRLARPADYDQRVVQVANLIDRAHGLGQRQPAVNAHPARAVCPRLSPANLEAIRASVAYMAVRAGLPAPAVSTSALNDPRPGAISPVQVSVDVVGPYAAAMDFLGRLEAVQPEVFVDTLDLKPNPSAVELKLTGKAYCWTVAH